MTKILKQKELSLGLGTMREKLLALDQIRSWMSCLDKILMLIG